QSRSARRGAPSTRPRRRRPPRRARRTRPRAPRPRGRPCACRRARPRALETDASERRSLRRRAPRPPRRRRPATLAHRPWPSVRRRSLERDHELADQVAVPGDAELTRTDALVGRPAVVGHGAVALVVHVPDLDLVVRRARLVGRADLVTATEGSHRHTFEP